MGLTIQPNQPIAFNLPEVCFDQPDYFQIIDQTDETQIQAIIQPCAGSPQLVANNDFSNPSPLEYWDYSGFTFQKNSTVCKDDGVWAYIQQEDIFTTDSVYQVAITVSDLFGEIGVYNGGYLIGTIKQNGVSYFTFVAQNGNIKLWITSGNYQVCVHSIQAYEINPALLVAIRSYSDDTIITTFDYTSNSDRFVFQKDTVTITIPWADLEITDGCYYLSIDDACTNTCGQLGLFNQEFKVATENIGTLTNTGWSSSGDGSAGIDDGNVLAGNCAVGQLVIIQNDITDYCAGKEYLVKFSIDSITNNGEIYISLGGTDSSTYTTTGIKTINITPASDGKFSINYSSDGFFATTMTISGLTITMVNTSDYSFENNSVPFKLGTFDCSMLVNLSNDNDAFGFVFENTFFAPRIRLDATLRNSKFPTERQIVHTSNGRKQVRFGLQRKQKEFATEGVQEYVHDFLALLPLADHLFIDGTEYHADDDEINITYPNSTQDYGQVIMLVSEKIQNRENRNLGNPSNPISATTGGYVIDVTQRYVILTEPSTGDTVEAL